MTEKKAEQSHEHNDDAVKHNAPEEQPVAVDHKKKKHSKPKKVHILEEELTLLQQKADELAQVKDDFLRKIADFENAKKRLMREKEEFAKFANEKIIAAFLPVLDNLDRALSHTENSDTVEALTSGIELIKKQIFTVLKDNGLEKIDARGKQFDPHVHEAVGMVKTDEHEAGMVVDEIQCGYLLKERLIRPAWVRVAEETDSSETEQTEETKPIEEDENGK